MCSVEEPPVGPCRCERRGLLSTRDVVIYLIAGAAATLTAILAGVKFWSGLGGIEENSVRLSVAALAVIAAGPTAFIGMAITLNRIIK